MEEKNKTKLIRCEKDNISYSIECRKGETPSDNTIYFKYKKGDIHLGGILRSSNK